jgi:hypothetical protein
MIEELRAMSPLGPEHTDNFVHYDSVNHPACAGKKCAGLARWNNVC